MHTDTLPPVHAPLTADAPVEDASASAYAVLQRDLARGWNTWNTRSMLSHVLLPEALALNVALKEHQDGQYLKEALMGPQDIVPGAHAANGRHTALTLRWRGLELDVESAHAGQDLVLLITPRRHQATPATLIVESSLLWNRPGTLQRDGDTLVARMPDRTVRVFVTGEPVEEYNVATQAPYLARRLRGPIGISTGRPRSIETIRTLLATVRAAPAPTGDALAECRDALRTVLAWDTIYEPSGNRVISPVSRFWSSAQHGGYVLFCWDTYLAALLAAPDNKALAYANIVEMTRAQMPAGYVPIMHCALTRGTDRSQPPVGSLAAYALYRRFGDRWLLDEVFEPFWRWNTWWTERRAVGHGCYAWGYEHPCTSTIAGFESGLDNSPMYDDVPFDAARGVMRLADVGLTALFAMDARLLARIARVLGRDAEARTLDARAADAERGLQWLWDEQTGIFRNRHTDTGAFSSRLSPTSFYPLLTDAVTPDQARRLIDEHFFNPCEFFGEWMLPAIARNDPAFPDQDYWRGRIWGPMNWLVFLGLKKYGLDRAAQTLSDKSAALLLKEWRAHRHIHENYNAELGTGCFDGKNTNGSDPFYHWGALLALIPLVEAGREPCDVWS